MAAFAPPHTLNRYLQISKGNLFEFVLYITPHHRCILDRTDLAIRSRSRRGCHLAAASAIDRP
jgi:hypothetical protein